MSNVLLKKKKEPLNLMNDCFSYFMKDTHKKVCKGNSSVLDTHAHAHVHTCTCTYTCVYLLVFSTKRYILIIR